MTISKEDKMLRCKERAHIKTKRIEEIERFGINGNLLASLSNTLLRKIIEELKSEVSN